MRHRAAACKLGAMSDANKRDPGGRSGIHADDQKPQAAARPSARPTARPASKPAAKPATRQSGSAKRRPAATGQSAAPADLDMASADQGVAAIEWGVEPIKPGAKPKRQRKATEPKRQRQAKEPRQQRLPAEPKQQQQPALKSPPQSPLPNRQREGIATYGRSEEAGRHDLVNILGWSLVALASAVLIAVIVAAVYILRVMFAS